MPDTIIEFAANPEKFLKVCSVIVPGELNQAIADHRSEGRLYNFKFMKVRDKWVSLALASLNDNHKAKAYFLEYKPNEVTTLTLGDAADLFFTAELTNCRFTVIDDNSKAPTVMHVAGTFSSRFKQETEETKKTKAMGKDKVAPALIRRLSISGSEAANLGSPKYKGSHQYAGQESGVPEEKRSSSFVFGYRDKEGNWQFKANITKGCLKAVNELTDNMQRLSYVDLLTDPSTERVPPQKNRAAAAHRCKIHPFFPPDSEWATLPERRRPSDNPAQIPARLEWKTVGTFHDTDERAARHRGFVRSFGQQVSYPDVNQEFFWPGRPHSAFDPQDIVDAMH